MSNTGCTGGLISTLSGGLTILYTFSRYFSIKPIKGFNIYEVSASYHEFGSSLMLSPYQIYLSTVFLLFGLITIA